MRVFVYLHIRCRSQCRLTLSHLISINRIEQKVGETNGQSLLQRSDDFLFSPGILLHEEPDPYSFHGWQPGSISSATESKSGSLDTLGQSYPEKQARKREDTYEPLNAAVVRSIRSSSNLDECIFCCQSEFITEKRILSRNTGCERNISLVKQSRIADSCPSRGSSS